MLTAVKLASTLQIYSQKELQSEAVSTNNVVKLLERSGIRKGSFDNLFPTMFSLHGLDIRETLNTAITSKDLTETEASCAVEGISRSMVALNRYPLLTVSKFRHIESLLQDFADILTTSDSINATDIALLKGLLELIKSEFRSPYIVTYASGSEYRLPSIKILHNSFSNLRSIVNKEIKKNVHAVLKERRITRSRLLEDVYLTTKIINWGHTRTGDSIISGKLIASIMSMKNLSSSVSNEAITIISKDFIKETGQEHTEIKLHRGSLTSGSNEVLSLVIKSEVVQKVIVQNRRYNQEDLGQLEKKWSLLESVKRGGDGLLKALGVSSIAELASKLINTRSSPSAVEDIGELIASKISGKPFKSTSKTVPLLNKKTPIKKTSKKVSLVSKTGETLRPDPIRTNQGQFYSLTSLQGLINQHLQSVISANMGDEGYSGGQRKILNYRTGRFAASAQVERMSQSREGAITAFYSYQKNPYQVFEVGHKMGSPITRDPKLLISSSIREIAATKVGNRLRAVSV